MHSVLLLIHLLAATIWTGGHLVLAIRILPQALKENSIDRLAWFEAIYENIGIPALVVQIITGVWMSFNLIPDFGQWFNMDYPVARLVLLKLLLLLITGAFALNARLRVIPNLSPETLKTLAWHIIPVTVISVLFVIVGLSFRTGWLG